jgi:hypothetical protein
MGTPIPTGADSRRARPPQPRDAKGRFAVVHGGRAALRAMRAPRPDKRRAPVKQAAALRDLIACCLGYAGWGEMPEPRRGLVELAAEVRVYRRLLAGPLWQRKEPPRRYATIAELERRVLVGLGGIEPQQTDVAALLAAMRREDGQR